jgi:hypothetical protein
MTENAAKTSVLKLTQQLQRLADAAAKCALNHSYYRLHGGGREVALLDCDFLWSSIRLQDAVARVKTKRDRLDEDFPALANQLAGWTGPHTIRHLMQGMTRSHRPFSIPPGAFAELLRRKKDLFGEVSEKSQALLDAFDNKRKLIPSYRPGAQQAPHTVSAVLDLVQGDLSAEIARQVRDEIATLDTMYDDARLLGSVLDSASSIGPLLGQASSKVSQSYSLTMKELGLSRPTATQNNFADAVNVLTLVWMFHSPNPGATVPMPVLVTNTNVVARLQTLLPLPNPDAEAQLLQSPLYLLMSQGFNELCSTLAEVENQAHTFANHVNVVIDACRQMLRLEPTSTIAFERMQRRLLLFIDRWGAVVDPLRRYPMLDQSSHNNALLSPEVEEVLSAFSDGTLPDSQRNMLVTLRKRLLDRFHRHDVIREVLLEVQSSKGDQKRDAYRESLFRLSLIEPSDRTTLLKNQLLGAAHVGPAPAHLPNGTRLAFGFDQAPKFGALLVADYDTSQGEPRLSVRWTHESDIVALIPALLGAATQLAKAENAEPVGINLFGLDEPTYQEMPLAEAKASTALRTECTLRDYVEIVLGDVGVYADIEPLVGQERQIGVVAPLERWNVDLSRTVETLARELRVPLPSGHVAWMLERVLKTLKSAAA